jgi:hypothetical protein
MSTRSRPFYFRFNERFSKAEDYHAAFPFPVAIPYLGV